MTIPAEPSREPATSRNSWPLRIRSASNSDSAIAATTEPFNSTYDVSQLAPSAGTAPSTTRLNTGRIVGTSGRTLALNS